MTPNQIIAQLGQGKTVKYTVRRLRGYTHGDASIAFTPKDSSIGAINLAHMLKCFRFDEKPYDNPRYEVI